MPILYNATGGLRAGIITLECTGHNYTAGWEHRHLLNWRISVMLSWLYIVILSYCHLSWGSDQTISDKLSLVIKQFARGEKLEVGL